MPHNLKLTTGKNGELMACHYLETKGLSLLEKNYYCYYGEIDLIMQDKEDVVFVEVRYRRDLGFGNALESVTRSKIRKLTKAALHYLQKKRCLYKVNSRFDIIAIYPLNGELTVEWVKHAFSLEN